MLGPGEMSQADLMRSLPAHQILQEENDLVHNYIPLAGHSFVHITEIFMCKGTVRGSAILQQHAPFSLLG